MKEGKHFDDLNFVLKKMYPGDTKILVKSSKERSGPTLNTTTRPGLKDKDLGN